MQISIDRYKPTIPCAAGLAENGHFFGHMLAGLGHIVHALFNNGADLNIWHVSTDTNYHAGMAAFFNPGMAGEPNLDVQDPS